MNMSLIYISYNILNIIFIFDTKILIINVQNGLFIIVYALFTYVNII